MAFHHDGERAHAAAWHGFVERIVEITEKEFEMHLSKTRETRLARRTIAHIRAGTSDLAKDVISFDPRMFSDPELAERERERIFYRQPMMAAHSSELREVGAFVTVSLNVSEVVLTRKADGSVGAFVNACRHRGARLVDDERGQRKIFTCKYHGWTYGNDGALRAITFRESFGAEPCPEMGLIPLPVEERHGFVWVVEDPEGAIDVARHLGPEIDALLAELQLGTHHFYKGDLIEFPQNWKVMMDGLLDAYHVRFLHGKTIAPFVYHNIITVDALSDHAFWSTPRKRIDEVLDQDPEDINIGRYMIFAMYLGPNTQLTIHPHHFEFWSMYQHPDGPEKSRVHLRFVTPNVVKSDEQKAILDKNYEILLNAVFNEDVPAGNGIQASSRMPQMKATLLGRNELLNQLFHRTINRLLQGESLGDGEDMRANLDLGDGPDALAGGSSGKDVATA